MTEKLQKAIKAHENQQKQLITLASECEHDAEIKILEYLKVWVKESNLDHAKIEAQAIYIRCIRFFDKHTLDLFERWINSSLEAYAASIENN